MTLTTKLHITDRKVAVLLTILVSAFVVLTWVQDMLRAALKDSAFYFSESFMFSSFWWLFVPLFFAQYVAVKQLPVRLRIPVQPLLIFLPMLVHLLAFPALVWMLSKAFYYHTFLFQQTFRYTVSEHVYTLVLLYSIPVLSFRYFLDRKQAIEIAPQPAEEMITGQFLHTILVTEGNKKSQVLISDIRYISANPPYITLHLENKKYLHKETLKSIAAKLDPEQFVRVHRSAVVNINMVASYTTRLNGDYDLDMKNKVQVRLSRNFAADFKNRFNKTHQDTTK